MAAAAGVAHLGGDAGSIDADRSELHAELRTTPMQQFDLHEITAPSGTLVHEYVTRQGRVFALPGKAHCLRPAPAVWRLLPALPGGRRGRMRPGMHRQVNITAADLVVQSSARTRSFRGWLYSSLLPGGVSAADLQ